MNSYIYNSNSKNIFMKFKNLLFAFFVIVFNLALNAQERVITTGAPFLRISPDARSGGMGDMGVATSSDEFSQYWNSSKYLFNTNKSGVGISYTPYLSNLTKDVFLLNASYFTKLGEEKNSALGASIYYFKMGEIELNQLVAGGIINGIGTAKPNEFALDVSYSLKLSETYGMGVVARYLRSDLFNGLTDASYTNSKAASTFAFDINGFYNSEEFESFGDTSGKVRAGFNVSNIGPRLNYTRDESVRANLPTNFRLGAGYDFIIEEDHKIGFTTEFNKLLVPTPINTNTITDTSSIGAIFSSWNDAPNGFSEELKEITSAVGLEYGFKDSFFFRTGYFNESIMKGGRQHITLGLGLNYQNFGIDFAYLIPTSQINSALENTLRFSLKWNFLDEE
ncbi:MAG: type IX secretion system outer membrane channel protein PorV [Solirubrobacteraceae bacterium]